MSRFPSFARVLCGCVLQPGHNRWRWACQVNVADAARLRKLRHSEDEHVLKGAVYRQRLRTQFEKIHGGAPSWASGGAAGRADDDDAADADAGAALTRRSTALLLDNRRVLAPTVLDVTRAKDANQTGVSQVCMRLCFCYVCCY